MLIPGLATIPRAALTLAFVWLMAPHQPDLGFGRLKAIETLLADSDACVPHRAKPCGGALFGAVVGSVADMEHSHNALLGTIARVRGDLRANGARVLGQDRL